MENDSENNKIKELEDEISNYRIQIEKRNKDNDFKGSVIRNFRQKAKISAVIMILTSLIFSQIIRFFPQAEEGFGTITLLIVFSLFFYLLVFSITMFLSVSSSDGEDYQKWKIKRLCILSFLVSMFGLVILFNKLFSGGVPNG